MSLSDSVCPLLEDKLRMQVLCRKEFVSCVLLCAEHLPLSVRLGSGAHVGTVRSSTAGSATGSRMARDTQEDGPPGSRPWRCVGWGDSAMGEPCPTLSSNHCHPWPLSAPRSPAPQDPASRWRMTQAHLWGGEARRIALTSSHSPRRPGRHRSSSVSSL